MQLLVVLSVLLGAVWLRLTEGCSCLPTHPQNQYCNGDYVMRVKIINKETIYPNMVQETTTAAPAQPTQSQLRLAPWLNEPLSAARLGPPGLLELPPFSDMRNLMMPTDIMYTVFVEKVYKGDEFISAKQLVKIRTAPFDSLCGVTDLPLRERFIISGRVHGGELNFGICDYTQQYSQVTKRQKQGLKYHWKKDCSDCQALPCFGQSCPPHKIPNSCSLDIAEGQDFSCKVDYARCSRNSQGECSWYGKKDFRGCLRQGRVLPDGRPLPFLP